MKVRATTLDGGGSLKKLLRDLDRQAARRGAQIKIPIKSREGVRGGSWSPVQPMVGLIVMQLVRVPLHVIASLSFREETRVSNRVLFFKPTGIYEVHSYLSFP